MTKADVHTVLTTIAEELEALDQADAARAYRRAATLVESIDDPTRRRRRRQAGATGTPAVAPAPTRKRRGRPARTAATTD